MKKYILVILLSLANVTASGDDLVIAVGLWIPPYVIKDENRGIELEILREVLHLAGHNMTTHYVPLGRTLTEFGNPDIDGIMSTGIKNLAGCYTDSHITYWNYAITRADRNIDLKTIDDLSSWSILAFQNASKYLGKDFENMARNSKRYTETADQRTQNRMLFLDRVDVIIGDRFIFQWFSRDNEVLKYTGVVPNVSYHEIFPPSHFQSVFKEQKNLRSIQRCAQTIKSIWQISGNHRQL